MMLKLWELLHDPAPRAGWGDAPHVRQGRTRGKAVQVETLELMLKAPGTKRLKLK